MKQKKKQEVIEYKRAVVYCRVSSDRQVKEGHGLDSQERRCVERANELKLEVASVFRDEGVSGGLFERPAMQALITFLDKHETENFVVIFDDISRLARDVYVHLKLKMQLTVERGAKLECLNQKIDDTEEGEFFELLFAGKAQLDRKQNRRQVIQKQKARLEGGYWAFGVPPGLVNKKHPTKGKILTPVQPLADIYKTAIEKFARYELPTIESVRIFILNSYREYGITKKLSVSGTIRILRQLLYTGYLEYEPWGVGRMKGQHEGFISLETHLQVLDILANKAKPRLRKDYNEDFPVRGFALCSDCIRPMTAAWFTGNGGKFAYYKCKTALCTMKNKSIRKKDLESSFENLLRKVCPQPDVIEFITAVLNDCWKDRKKIEEASRNKITKEVEVLSNQNRQLVLRCSQTDNHVVAQEFEKMISDNISAIDTLQEKLTRVMYPDSDFQTALKTVIDFVGSPIKQWESRVYRRQRLLLAMYFEQKLIYDLNFGFQTVKLPLMLELSQQKMTPKGHLVEMAGVKPASKTGSTFNWSQD